MNEGNCQFAVEFHPSLVQLHLQKNVFEIMGRGSESEGKVPKSQTEGMEEELPPEIIASQFEKLSTETGGTRRMCETLSNCSREQEGKAFLGGLGSKFSEEATEEFKLDLVRQSDDEGGEISDDSDYGSPR